MVGIITANVDTCPFCGSNDIYKETKWTRAECHQCEALAYRTHTTGDWRWVSSKIHEIKKAESQDVNAVNGD